MAPEANKEKLATEKISELRKKIEDKIDQYNKATFPASDAPQWDSLQDLEHELKELETKNQDEPKSCSSNQQS